VFVNSGIHNDIFDENLDETFRFPISSLNTFMGAGRDAVATKRILENRLKVQRPSESGLELSGGKGGRLDS